MASLSTSTIATTATDFPVTRFEGEDIEYVSPSWDQLNELAFRVAARILAQDLHFDRIVTLAKGGWPMTRSLVDFLSVDQVASIGVKFYAGIKQRLTQPEVYQDIPVSVMGERVLLFDDVADSGESLKFVDEYLRTRGVGQVTTAALFYKPHSIVKPDFYGAETTGWILFPYDMVESVQVLGKKWGSQGLNQTQIIERFKQLGFRTDWVTEYCQRLLV